MKILALEHDNPRNQGTAAGPDLQPLLKSEALRVWELNQAGIIREMYFRADRHSAVLSLECETVEEAADALETLPLVRAGIITFELIPLSAYPGFSRLFATLSDCYGTNA